MRIHQRLSLPEALAGAKGAVPLPIPCPGLGYRLRAPALWPAWGGSPRLRASLVIHPLVKRAEGVLVGGVGRWLRRCRRGGRCRLLGLVAVGFGLLPGRGCLE